MAGGLNIAFLSELFLDERQIVTKLIVVGLGNGEVLERQVVVIADLAQRNKQPFLIDNALADFRKSGSQLAFLVGCPSGVLNMYMVHMAIE